MHIDLGSKVGYYVPGVSEVSDAVRRLVGVDGITLVLILTLWLLVGLLIYCLHVSYQNCNQFSEDEPSERATHNGSGEGGEENEREYERVKDEKKKLKDE